VLVVTSLAHAPVEIHWCEKSIQRHPAINGNLEFFWGANFSAVVLQSEMAHSPRCFVCVVCACVCHVACMCVHVACMCVPCGACVCHVVHVCHVVPVHVCAMWCACAYMWRACVCHVVPVHVCAMWCMCVPCGACVCHLCQLRFSLSGFRK
jgi:hypothetical protein